METRALCRDIGIALLIAIWMMVLFAFHILGHPKAMAHLEVLRLQEECATLQDAALAEEQLRSAVSKLSVELRTNHYNAEVTYFSSSNWVIKLRPERDRSYANPRSWITRFVMLDFYTASFPEVEVHRTLAEKGLEAE